MRRSLLSLLLICTIGSSLVVGAPKALAQFLQQRLQDYGVSSLSQIPPSARAPRDVDVTGSISKDLCPWESAPKTAAFPEVMKIKGELGNFLTPALELTGECIDDNDANRDHAESVANLMRSRVASRAPLRIKKRNGGAPTPEDWVTIDLLARTLYGEIGGSSACSRKDAFFKAVGRIIMNRREFMADKARAKFTNFFKSGGSVKNPLALVATKPNEFQAWRDHTNATMACPGKTVGPVIGKNGKKKGYVGPFDTVRWMASVDIASQMVFDEERFRCETKELRGIFYAKSNMKPGRNFQPVKNVRIDGELIDDPNCVQLWENPANPFRSQTPDCETRLVRN